jgi:hypothetical protein
VHARRAGGHAGEAGQAAVDVRTTSRRRPVVLQHVLDQVDAARAGCRARRRAARRSGRSRCRSRSARRCAGFRWPPRCPDRRAGPGEIGLHGLDPRVHAAGIEHPPLGSKPSFTRCRQRRERRRLRLEHLDRRRGSASRARISVAWPPTAATASAHERVAASPSARWRARPGRRPSRNLPPEGGASNSASSSLRRRDRRAGRRSAAPRTRTDGPGPSRRIAVTAPPGPG